MEQIKAGDIVKYSKPGPEESRLRFKAGRAHAGRDCKSDGRTMGKFMKWYDWTIIAIVAVLASYCVHKERQ